VQSKQGGTAVTLISIAFVSLGLAQAPANRAPLADTDFVANVAKISRDFMNATEFFVVDPSTALRPTGKAAAELARVMPSLRQTAKPSLSAQLEKADWAAYRDIGHRVEPLVASCSFDGETVRWSFGDYVAAMLVDLPAAVDLGDARKANAFALDFLSRHLSLPDRSGAAAQFFLKSNNGIWGGYVDRLPPETDKEARKRLEWDNYFLFITDGHHVLVRWNLRDLERQDEGLVKGHPSGPVPPKTKSRFDE
jgi:hypothetical protein